MNNPGGSSNYYDPNAGQSNPNDDLSIRRVLGETEPDTTTPFDKVLIQKFSEARADYKEKGHFFESGWVVYYESTSNHELIKADPEESPRSQTVVIGALKRQPGVTVRAYQLEVSKDEGLVVRIEQISEDDPGCQELISTIRDIYFHPKNIHNYTNIKSLKFEIYQRDRATRTINLAKGYLRAEFF